MTELHSSPISSRGRHCLVWSQILLVVWLSCVSCLTMAQMSEAQSQPSKEASNQATVSVQSDKSTQKSAAHHCCPEASPSAAETDCCTELAPLANAYLIDVSDGLTSSVFDWPVLPITKDQKKIAHTRAPPSEPPIYLRNCVFVI